MKNTPSDYFWLNLSFLFISTSGALGKWIDLPPEQIIFWRSLFSIPFLLLFLWTTKQSIKISFQWNASTLLAGVLMGTHWVTYFYALQWSNVAVGMLSLFTFPVITAFLEPLFFNTRFNKKHIFLGGLTLLGIYFLVPSFDLAKTHGPAIALGVFSALCYAIRNILLKKARTSGNGSQQMLAQVVIIALCFVPFISQETVSMNQDFWPALVFLALFTTVIGHSMFLFSLTRFSVTSASIAASVQPLYGILIAYFFLNEIPHWGTYIGGTLIVFAVLVEGLSSKEN
ncbi:DMT family transporter [Flavobacteriaceae bacterium]|nr:DMT family transporter [Flavobacteriaceae bacterium]MDA9244718.1 DMT family transporter [Flavobacteriaceae bacterium]MDA9886480.1 DMT family transporter [Flavobacteriaceae bacterium]MDA9984781.1 DMT family transporter [Flavobacteriaceae bacterium]MDB4187402.1 DMT family transporter [Flavobacteriaceae bacterium]